jgi:hypothetical protein
MNEQTKTHIKHASEIAELTQKYKERLNMCDLLHKHIGDLNKKIIDLKIQMTVASECHESRLKDMRDKDIIIDQLKATLMDVWERLKSDSSSKYLTIETRIYADKIIDVLQCQYYENLGSYFNDND